MKMILTCLAGTTLAFCGPVDVPTIISPIFPFDNQTNGFEDQAAFTRDRESFEEVDTILREQVCAKDDDGKCVMKETKGGIGPVYNATSCVSCHQNPVTGSSSQISEVRAGHFGPAPGHPERLAFIDHPGGSLVHDRSVSPRTQEHLTPADTNRTLRMSTNILGDGFVECIADADLIRTVGSQRSVKFGDMRGTVVLAPVALTADTSREHVGRFGWKNQHASLLNFSADAYVNEMGITSVLQPNENLPDGNPIPPGVDPIPDPEDPADDDHPFGEDVESFTRFMRSTKPPPREVTIGAVTAGEKLFNDRAENGKVTGCAICHVPKFTTRPAGSPIDGNFPGGVVPPALGGKDVFPFSDFLLHDIGTGDGIVQTQHAQFPPRSSKKVLPLELDRSDLPLAQEAPVIHLFAPEPSPDIPAGDLIDTARMLRTAPLWGLRVRTHLLHDGLALTVDEAIRKHSGQAEKVKLNYANMLSQEERDQLLAFLSTL